MRRLSDAADAAAARERKRQWHWCRRPNGFSDMPKWRMVAERLKLPLFQIVAFVNRLEEFANDAGNKGFGRGEIVHFSAEEFGQALGMPEADAARIFAALEDPKVGWIQYGQVFDFYERNRDKEDDTAALRQRRKRGRAEVLSLLVKLAHLGQINAADRAEVESRLPIVDDTALFNLKAELNLALSTGTGVTRDIRRDSRRDIVTSRQSREHQFQEAPVDNNGDGESRAIEEAADQQAGVAALGAQAHAVLWLDGDGKRIVTERMEWPPPKAEQRIARWRDQDLEGDAVALVAVIKGADATDYLGARFHNLVTDGIRRAQQQKLGPQLPLMPAGIRKATG